MSFIEIAIQDAQEEVSVPEAVYDLRVTDATLKDNAETKRQSVMCMIEIENPPEDTPNVATVFHFMNLPNKNDDAKSTKFMMLQIRRFLVAFDVPHEGNGFSPEDIPGSTAEMLLCEEEYEGDMKNSLRLPRIEE